MIAGERPILPEILGHWSPLEWNNRFWTDIRS